MPTLPRNTHSKVQRDPGLTFDRDGNFETKHETNPEGATVALKRIVPLHAGVPGSRKSGSMDAFWMTSREIADLRNRRKEEFRKQGAIVSTTMLANFRGTPEASAHALEHAAQFALDAHIRRMGSLVESQNNPVMSWFSKKTSSNSQRCWTKEPLATSNQGAKTIGASRGKKTTRAKAWRAEDAKSAKWRTRRKKTTRTKAWRAEAPKSAKWRARRKKTTYAKTWRGAHPSKVLKGP